jgi:DNA-binding transcriptional LysR family regulator
MSPLWIVREPTALPLVSCRLGSRLSAKPPDGNAPGVTLLSVDDLDFAVPCYLIWRKDDQSALLRRFVMQVQACMWPWPGKGHFL